MLDELNFEILEKIFVLAQNPCLSIVNKKFYSIANTTYIQLEYIIYSISSYLNLFKDLSEPSTTPFVIDTGYEAFSRLKSIFGKYPKLGNKPEIYERLILKAGFTDKRFIDYVTSKTLICGWRYLLETILSTFRIEILVDHNENDGNSTNINSTIINISADNTIKCRITPFLSNMVLNQLAMKSHFIKDEFLECLNLLINLKNKRVCCEYLIEKIQNHVKTNGTNIIVLNHKKFLDISNNKNSVPLFSGYEITFDYKKMLLLAIKFSHNEAIDLLTSMNYFTKFKSKEGQILSLVDLNEKHEYLSTSVSFSSEEVLNKITGLFSVSSDECYLVLKKMTRFKYMKSVEKLMSFASKPLCTPDQILLYASDVNHFKTTLGVEQNQHGLNNTFSLYLSEHRKAEKRAMRLVNLCLANGAKISFNNYSPVKKALENHMFHTTRYYISLLNESGLKLADVLSNEILVVGFKTLDICFIKLLLESGVDPTIENGASLINACASGHIGITNLLTFEIAIKTLEISCSDLYNRITNGGARSHEYRFNGLIRYSGVLYSNEFMTELSKKCMKISSKNREKIKQILFKFGYSI
ncbi:hypothetical protein BB558_002528 [Smittium angustum]|uniref:Uncharacterized protein n=1 Tax=Smittium angustum TaxID=133377 RepID=A0A2U1J8K0_SMIAN|nr:hypothetical protein BB558_002528 [Smittium angustum]